ncbi:hypothetical protein [Aphanizomenon flos-aquae]|nr:hypothetical protein [Aphanizomenon flos-aquae]
MLLWQGNRKEVLGNLTFPYIFSLFSIHLQKKGTGNREQGTGSK